MKINSINLKNYYRNTPLKGKASSFSGVDNSYLYKNAPRVANLNDINTKIVVPFEDEKISVENTLSVTSTELENGKISQEIKDNKGNVVAKVKRNKDCNEKIMAMTGSSGLAVFIQTQNGLLYRMCETSKFTTRDLQVELPQVNHFDPSFEGNLYVSMSKDQQSSKVIESINNFWNLGNIKYFEGQKSPYSPKQDYNVFIPAGGKGTRSNTHKIKFDKNSNYTIDTPKPSIPVPIKSYNDKSQNMTLIEFSMGSFVAPNMLNSSSQRTFIEEETGRGNAYSFLTSLQDGTLSVDKPVFVGYSDSISDIDFQKFLHSYENRNDVAALLTAFKVNRESVPNVGLFKLEENPNDNLMKIHAIVEKTTDENLIKKFELEDGTFYSNRSYYILSPEALKALKVLTPDISKIKNVDFVQDIFETLRQITAGEKTHIDISEENYKKAQEILKGKSLYVDMLEGKRSDVGNLRKFINTSNMLRRGEFKYPKEIVESFIKNTDKKGCVYMSDVKELSDAYLKSKSGTISGNILVDKI